MDDGYEGLGIYELHGALNTEQRLLANIEDSLVFYGGELEQQRQTEVNGRRERVSLIRTMLARRQNIHFSQEVCPSHLMPTPCVY